MDRLSLFLTLMSGSAITGALVITFFSLDWYSGTAVAVAAVIGFVAAWPSARLISKRIKDRDELYDRPEPDGILPDPKGPET